MFKTLRFLLTLITLVLLALPVQQVTAQSTTNGPIYIVQEGDSLWDIAYRFHVTQDALARANGIIDTNQIKIGQQLVIPGLEGIQGFLTTQNVPFGESLQSLSLRNHLTPELLKRLNHLTSPDEIYAGFSLVVIRNEDNIPSSKRVALSSDQSVLELAILNDTDPWTLLANNQMSSSAVAIPGEVMRAPGVEDNGPGALPAVITSMSLSDLIQGQTAEIKLVSNQNLTISGTFNQRNLSFFHAGADQYVSLQGIHAMTEPGLYPLTIAVTFSDSSSFEFSQNALVSSGNYIHDKPLTVDPATLDPETTGPEDIGWYALSDQISSEKLWQGIFSIPVETVFAECYTSQFGNRRSYNGSPYKYFHTGLDFCGQIGDSIFAAAPGVVVFAGPLSVRGKATMIDHGWGVYTAYMHQSEILVNVGDHVGQGVLIGKVGDTGRVEGPHLHFEVLVGGVQVNPLEWLNQAFP